MTAVSSKGMAAIALGETSFPIYLTGMSTAAQGQSKVEGGDSPGRLTSGDPDPTPREP